MGKLTTKRIYENGSDKSTKEGRESDECTKATEKREKRVTETKYLKEYTGACV
jgi:hypothetical protein